MIDKLRAIHRELFPGRNTELWEPSDSDLVIGTYFDRELKKAREEIRLLQRHHLKP